MKNQSLSLCSIILLSFLCLALAYPSDSVLKADERAEVLKKIKLSSSDCELLDGDNDSILTFEEYQASMLSLSIRERTKITKAMHQGSAEAASDECMADKYNPLVATNGLYPHVLKSLERCDSVDLNRDGHVNNLDLEHVGSASEKSFMVETAIQDPLCA